LTTLAELALAAIILILLVILSFKTELNESVLENIKSTWGSIWEYLFLVSSVIELMGIKNKTFFIIKTPSLQDV
jgi:hypothetical protein